MNRVVFNILSSFLLLVFISGCATYGATLKKPPLYITYDHEYKEVWQAIANTLSTQSLVLMEGSVLTKNALFMKQDSMGIPLIAVYVELQEIEDEKTKVILRYNSDGAITFYSLKGKVEFIADSINNNLMMMNRENSPREYKILNLEEWHSHYVHK